MILQAGGRRLRFLPSRYYQTAIDGAILTAFQPGFNREKPGSEGYQAAGQCGRRFHARRGRSVLGRPFDVVDDDELEGRLTRFESEAQLFLYRGEDRRSGVIGSRLPGIRSPVERDVEESFQFRGIDDRTIHPVCQVTAQSRHADAIEFKVPTAVLALNFSAEDSLIFGPPFAITTA